MSNEEKTPKKGVDLTVYRISKSHVYTVDANGQKYRSRPIKGLPYFVGMRLNNVVFA